ncbi:MAG: DUF2877 domain-containing protein [Nakamurella sp.]
MAVLPASAAAGVLPVITGAPSTGVVLGSLSRAVIVGVTTAAGPRVVSLLDQQAAGGPNGVRILGDTRFDDIRPGDSALIGASKVRIGPLSVRVVRSWDSRVRSFAPDPALVAQLTAATVGHPLGIDQALLDHLQTALASGRDVPAAIDAMIGLGRGLTPGGDDVVAGLMTGLHAVGHHPMAHRIGDQALENQTTALSADLLRLARDGHACLEALAVLTTLHRPDVPVTDAIDRLLSIGHTSGADLATGMLIGLRFERVDDATHLNAPWGVPRFGDPASDVPGGGRRGRYHQRSGGNGYPVEHRTGSGTGLLDP